MCSKVQSLFMLNTFNLSLVRKRNYRVSRKTLYAFHFAIFLSSKLLRNLGLYIFEQPIPLPVENCQNF